MEEAPSVKPTRPLSAYICFSNDMVPKFKAEKGCSHQEAMKLAGAKWKELTKAELEPYEKQHQVHVERYEKQLKEVKDKGYFVMSDGTKSNEVHIMGTKRKAGDADKEPTRKKGLRALKNGEATAEKKGKVNTDKKPKKEPQAASPDKDESMEASGLDVDDSN